MKIQHNTDLREKNQCSGDSCRELLVKQAVFFRFLLVMDQTLENTDLSENVVNVKASMIVKKCNQCTFSSNDAGNLRRHLKTHSGEKPNKCNYAASRAIDLRRHLKSHSGEKTNKCNQCDFASSWASALRAHLKTHSRENKNKCNQCDYASSQAGHLMTHTKDTVEKSQTNVTSVILHPSRQAI